MTSHKDIKTWEERYSKCRSTDWEMLQKDIQSCMKDEISDCRAYSEQVERERDALREQLAASLKDAQWWRDAAGDAGNLIVDLQAKSQQPVGAVVAGGGQFDWMKAERIRDEDHVDEALRVFREDPTGDNATGIIQAALTVWTADCAALAEQTAAHSDDSKAFEDAIASGRLIWDFASSEREIAYQGFKAGRTAQTAAPQTAEIDFLEEWLTLASTPVGLECCGKSWGECCGNGVAIERSAEDVITAIAERHRELSAALTKQGESN